MYSINNVEARALDLSAENKKVKKNNSFKEFKKMDIPTFDDLIDGFERLHSEVLTNERALKCFPHSQNPIIPQAFEVDVNHNVRVPLAEDIINKMSGWFSKSRKETLVNTKSDVIVSQISTEEYCKTKSPTNNFQNSNSFFEGNYSPALIFFKDMFSTLWDNPEVCALTLCLTFAFSSYYGINRESKRPTHTIVSKALLTCSLIWGMIAASFAYHKSTDNTKFISLISNLNFLQNRSEASFAEDDVAEPQGFEDHKDYFVETLVLATSMMVGSTAKQPVTVFFKDIIRVNRNQKETLGEILLNASSLLSTFLEKTTNLSTLTEYFEVSKFKDDRVNTLIERAKDFISSANAGLIYYETFKDIVYLELVADIKKLLKDLDNRSYDHKALTSCLTDLEKLSVSLKTFEKSLSADRIEPVGVLLMGAPGCMKTALLDRISHLFAKYTIPEMWTKDYNENPSRYIFSAPTDKFHDGYSYKSWVYILDDLFQRREAVADTEADSLKIIKLINPAPYLLQMANVNEKNTKFFRSAMVAGTTNLTSENFDSALQAIQKPQAVARRFHFTIKVSINDKYHFEQETIKESLPMMELVSDTGETYNTSSIPDDYWILNVTIWEGNKKTDLGVILFEDLIVMMVERYQKHVKNFYVNKVTTEISYNNLVSKLDNKIKGANKYGSWFGSDSVSKPFINSCFPAIPQSFDDDIIMEKINHLEEPESVYEDAEENYDEMFLSYLTTILKGARFSDELISKYKRDFSLNPKRVANPDFINGYLFEHNNNSRRNYKDYTIFSKNKQSAYKPEDLEIKEYVDGILLYRAHIRELHILWNLYSERRITAKDLQSWHKCFSVGHPSSRRLDYEAEFYVMLHVNNLSYLIGNLSLEDLITSQDIHTQITLINHIENKEYLFETLRLLLLSQVNKNINVMTGSKMTWRDTFKIGVQKFSAKSYRIMLKIKRFISDNYIMIAVGSGLFVGAVKLIYKIYKLFRGEDISEPHSMDQSRNSGRSSHSRRVIKLSKNIEKLPARIPQGLAVEDVVFKSLPKLEYSNFGAQDSVNNILATIFNKYFFNAFVTFDYGNGPVVRRLGHVWNLKGQIFGCPMHFIMTLNNERSKDNYRGAVICISNPTKTNCYKVTLEDLINNFETTTRCADNDFCAFKLRQSQRSSVGISKFLLKENDVLQLSRSSTFAINIVGTEMIYQNDRSYINTRFVMTKGRFTSNQVFKATWEIEDDLVYKITRTVTYDKECHSGDCGSVLSLNDNNFQNRTILGMHIGGYNKAGFGSIITQEMIEEIDDVFDHGPVFNDEEEIVGVYPYVSEPHGNLQSFMKFDSDHSLSSPSNSDIKKSLIHGKLPKPFDKVTTRPVRLGPYIDSEGLLQIPMYKAILGYGFEAPTIEDTVLVQASSSYEQLIRSKTEKFKDRRVWSVKEALHAKDNVRGIASSTSSGYPMNLKNVEDLKKKYLNYFNAQEFDKAELYYDKIETRIGELIELYDNNIRPAFIYYDFPKDETREIGKDCRMISGSPFDYLLLVRMYFGAFMDAFIGTNIDVGSAIGINPFSCDWDRLARELRKFGRVNDEYKVGAGDYKKYDGHEQPAIHNETLDIINAWYGYNDEYGTKIRTFLWAEITNSKHHFCNELIEWFNSMPSGNPMTAIINTMNNNIYFRCSWIILANPIYDFNTHVYFVGLGDDNSFCVHPKYHHSFNEMLLPAAMHSLGQIYTTETKTEASEVFRNLEDIEFLKRKFIYSIEANRYIAPLRQESMINMLNWTKKKKNGKERKSPEQITVDNIATALREFALHGRNTYKYWYSELIKLKEDYYEGYEFECLVHRDYHMALTETLGGDHIWYM